MILVLIMETGPMEQELEMIHGKTGTSAFPSKHKTMIQKENTLRFGCSSYVGFRKRKDIGQGD
jgi:cell division protein FtsI/penicillin-binding protein 2